LLEKKVLAFGHLSRCGASPKMEKKVIFGEAFGRQRRCVSIVGDGEKGSKNLEGGYGGFPPKKLKSILIYDRE
jgi:hypothetical protein